MPPRRTYKRRRNYRRRAYKKKIATRGKIVVSRGLRQAVHYFKRRTMSYMHGTQLAGFTQSDDLKAYHKTFHFNFSMMEGYQELANLYHQYKICGVRIKMFMSPQIITGARLVQPMILRYKYNRTGDEIPSSTTESTWLQQGAVKYKTIPQRKHLTFYCKPRVSKTVYSGTVSGYGVAKPTWFGTTNAVVAGVPTNNQQGIPHYCFDMRLSKVDGQMIAADDMFPFLAIETTLYIACKGVK